jgi:hypothetical protein
MKSVVHAVSPGARGDESDCDLFGHMSEGNEENHDKHNSGLLAEIGLENN